MCYIGSVNGTRLRFLLFEPDDIKLTRISATAHSRCCNTCCVHYNKGSAVLSENGEWIFHHNVTERTKRLM